MSTISQPVIPEIRSPKSSASPSDSESKSKQALGSSDASSIIAAILSSPGTSLSLIHVQYKKMKIL